MDDRFIRTAMVFGPKKTENLAHKHIAIFGIGGVGGYIAEATARSGIGKIDLIDRDCVSLSNINRQIVALESTLGKPKAEAMKERILDINPNAEVNVFNTFYLPENADCFDLSQYDYIADAVDTVSAKIELACRAKAANVPIISAMGAGNKTDPTKFLVADIFDTSECPLARVMRHELKKRQIEKLRVVYSKEKALKPLPLQKSENSKVTPASLAFVPSVMGLIMAGEIIKDLVEYD